MQLKEAKDDLAKAYSADSAKQVLSAAGNAAASAAAQPQAATESLHASSAAAPVVDGQVDAKPAHAAAALVGEDAGRKRRRTANLLLELDSLPRDMQAPPQ